MLELQVASRVGRPSSGVDRKVQLALAQKKKRDNDKKDGLKPVNVSVSGETKTYFMALCQVHNLTQRELLEALVDAAIKNGSLLK
ncbi:hypothetical protein [Aquitalea pelogenes]|uniref:hypothetical protein n=1 Tax=Aquitalea pelogenes TaxID=1293573 RepID=UPI0035B4451C